MKATAYLSSPLGLIMLIGSDAGLSTIGFQANPERHQPNALPRKLLESEQPTR